VLGVIDKDTNVAGETVSVVCPETPAYDAVMDAVPTAREIPSPVEETVAIPGAEDTHTATLVRLCVPPSE
jgi:hypothetical protein